RVNHSCGNYRLKCIILILEYHFIMNIEALEFDAIQALEILYKLYTVDYKSSKAGSKAADIKDKYLLVFFLNYISIIGRPLKPITQPTDRFFDNVTITFQN
ncbi:hypothetical protein K469DRAFT_606088, partial [Zopfia rhizophila CBS 207.26]